MKKRKKPRLHPMVAAIRREAKRIGIVEAEDPAGWAALCLLHGSGYDMHMAIARANRNRAMPQAHEAQLFWADVAEAVVRVSVARNLF